MGTMTLHTTALDASRGIARSTRPRLAAATALVTLSIAACGRFRFTPSADDSGPGGGLLDSSPPGPTLVQQSTSFMTPVSSLTGTLPRAPTPGNLLVILAAYLEGNLQPPLGGGVTDWRFADGSIIHSNIEIWYGVVSAQPDAAVTISAAMTNSTTPILATVRLQILEWSGLVATKQEVLDAASAGSGGVSPASAPTIMTTHPADLVVFGISDLDETSMIGAPTDGPWQALDPIKVLDDSIQRSWYRTISTAGSLAPAVADPAAKPKWDAAIAAFKVAP